MHEPLPGQLPNHPAGQRHPELSDAVLQAAVEHSIAQARQQETTPQVLIGSTPPVPQPDSRIVPPWAAGIAVASIGVGAGATGLGCAVWLAMRGLALVSVPGLERFAWIIIAPFAGAAMLLTAGGAAISKAKKASPPVIHNHNSGPVIQDSRQDHSTHKSRHFSLTTRNDIRTETNAEDLELQGRRQRRPAPRR
ncbi:hypothetical protein [Streptomyces sp. KL116D]|uniref:hypothetical protein n=1 Tax=Streptomyces sp. KL116D TaxID=3045152 RepID=UPI003558669B